MRQVIAGIVSVAAAVTLLSGVPAAAEPRPTTGVVSVVPDPMPPVATPPYIAEPYVPQEFNQFKFLGYKVSRKGLVGKLSKKDRAEVKRFQSKFGLPQTGKVDKRTVKALDKFAGRARLPKRCLTGEFTLCINKFNRTLHAVNPDGSIAKVTDTRFGMPGLETREGKFRVQRKGGAHHISTQYQVEMPYPLFFSGGQAVHFSWEFYYNPATKSHGCIGTRDMATQKWLWNHSPVGTRVVVFDKAPAKPLS